MGSCLSFVKRIFKSKDAKIHRLFPVLVLAIYSLIGGGIFYPLLRQYKDEEQLSRIRFWDSLYYASTAYTTIGYGTVTCHASSSLCRAITIIYSLIGIPITLVTLNRLGKFLAAIACFFWHECCLCKLCKGKKKVKISDSDTLERGQSRLSLVSKKKKVKRTLPLWVTCLLLVSWLLLMAMVYSLTQGWGYGTSVYYVLESMMTIGFGDVPEKPQTAVCLVYQAMIIIGLSLFSMLINVAEDHVDQLAVVLSAKITQQYKDRLAKEEEERENQQQEDSKKSVSQTPLRKTTSSMPLVTDKSRTRLASLGILGGGKQKGTPKEDDENGEKKEEKQFFKKAVNDAKAGWYSFFLNDSTRERLEEEYEKKIKMKSAKTQTATETKTAATQTHIKAIEKKFVPASAVSRKKTAEKKEEEKTKEEEKKEGDAENAQGGGMSLFSKLIEKLQVNRDKDKDGQEEDKQKEKDQ